MTKKYILKQKSKTRNYDQLLNHFLVEKEIASRLKSANRDERKLIYEGMYDELFARVPDHPRILRRRNPAQSQKNNNNKLRLLSSLFHKDRVFLEFAPGDCLFLAASSVYFKSVIGVDISNQTEGLDLPENFELIVYNGYDLSIADESVDVVFSDQLIEHLHPEDTENHFSLIFKILKKDGCCIFRTPHEINGPHDVSMFFSDEAEGFHLKEWTYSELYTLLKGVGFIKIVCYWERGGFKIRLPRFYFRILENIFSTFNKQQTRRLSKWFLPNVTMRAIK